MCILLLVLNKSDEKDFKMKNKKAARPDGVLEEVWKVLKSLGLG